jgi:hypothetical protein
VCDDPGRGRDRMTADRRRPVAMPVLTAAAVATMWFVAFVVPVVLAVVLVLGEGWAFDQGWLGPALALVWLALTAVALRRGPTALAPAGGGAGTNQSGS